MNLYGVLGLVAWALIGAAVDASSWNTLKHLDHNATGNFTGPATLSTGNWSEPEFKQDKLYGGRHNDSIPSLGGYRRNMGLLLRPSDDVTDQLQGCITVRIAPTHFITRASCVRDPDDLPTLFVETANATSAGERRPIAIQSVTPHPDFGVNLAIVHVDASDATRIPRQVITVALADVSPAYYVPDATLTLVSIDNIFNPSLAQNPRYINKLIRVPVASCQYDSDDAAVNCYAPADLANRERAFEFGQGMLIWKNLGLVGLPDCEGLCSGGMFYSATHLAKFKPWINEATNQSVQWIRPVSKLRTAVNPVAPEHEPTFVSLQADNADQLACGGALIAPRFVLTTASCVANRTVISASVNHGARADALKAHEDVIPVVGVMTHPLFGANSSSSNDIAIIQLSAPTIYTPTLLASSDLLSETQNATNESVCTPRLSGIDASIMCVPPQDTCPKVGDASELVPTDSELVSAESSGSMDDLVAVGAFPADSGVPSAIERWNEDAGDAVFDVPEAARYYLVGLSVPTSTNATNSWCSSADANTNSLAVVRVATPATMEFIDANSVDHTWRNPNQLPMGVLANKLRRASSQESTGIMATSFSVSYSGDLEFEAPPTDIDLGFVVGLRQDKYGQNFCGGSLIAPSFVLTAAHCVAGGHANFVSVGSRDSLGAEAELISVMKSHVITHPQYGKRSLYSYDVAILELQSPAYPKPIVLDNSREINPLSYMTLLGYGANSASSTELSKVLRSVDLPLFPRAKCKTMFPELDASMFCAGGELARDACTGDSGSPLIRMVDGKPLLVGVVSSGRNGCGTPGVPGVYAWVAEMQSFIDGVVAGDSWVLSTAATRPPTPTPAGNESRTDAGGVDDTVLRSSALNMSALPFEIVSMASGGGQHQLSIIELAQDTSPRLQAAVMQFLVGDYENVGGWTPEIQQRWKIAFYSTGDLTGIMQVIAKHEENRLYARENRFGRPIATGRTSDATYSSRASCTGGH